ncbi:hypothetical protein CCZ27_02520 [Thauera sinica]|nr:hypothetical protein CCZ27_02520 [Thauera sp. K11]
MGSTARKAVRNADRVMGLEQAMFDWRSRHVILVLTLTYKPEWQHEITLDIIRQHRDQLLNNRRGNALLRGINGYVWKIEEGHDAGGLHLHVVIFYNGNHRADIHIARSIGDYWVNVITHDKGAYWNSNAQKEHHARYGHGIGTGQIDRHDHDRREALRQNLLYLAKNDQHVTTRMNPHYRTFGTSQFPA